MRNLKLLAAIVIPAALAMPAAHAAQPAFPDKPIRLIIGSARPGSAPGATGPSNFQTTRGSVSGAELRIQRNIAAAAIATTTAAPATIGTRRRVDVP